MSPADLPARRQVFHEGLQVPPVKIKKAGKDVDDIWRILLANVRTPLQHGRLPRVAATDLGERRMAQPVQIRIGNFRGIVILLMDYSGAAL
jgi:N-methylhydantoinase B/oxoprolinase/acetone carboxylase alpha subunit